MPVTVLKVEISYIALVFFGFYLNLDSLRSYNFLLHFGPNLSFSLCKVQTTPYVLGTTRLIMLASLNAWYFNLILLSTSKFCFHNVTNYEHEDVNTINGWFMVSFVFIFSVSGRTSREAACPWTPFSRG